MRHTALLFGIGLMVLLSACQSETYQWINVGEQFRIEVPSYLIEEANMHPDAALQMGDPYRSSYLLVRYDSLPGASPVGPQTLEDFYISTFKRLLPGVPVPYPDSLNLGGLVAMRIRTDAHHEGTKVVYDLTLVQSPYFLYQILSWTEKDRAAAYEADQTRMVESFEEL